MTAAYGSLAARRRRRRWIRHARRERARLNGATFRQRAAELGMQFWLQTAVMGAALAVMSWSAADVNVIHLDMAPTEPPPAVTAPGHHAHQHAP